MTTQNSVPVCRRRGNHHIVFFSASRHRGRRRDGQPATAAGPERIDEPLDVFGIPEFVLGVLVLLVVILVFGVLAVAIGTLCCDSVVSREFTAVTVVSFPEPT